MKLNGHFIFDSSSVRFRDTFIATDCTPEQSRELTLRLNEAVVRTVEHQPTHEELPND